MLDSLVLVCFELLCDRQMCPSLQTPKPQTFFFCICSNTCTLFIPELTFDHPYNIHTFHQTFLFSQSHGTPKCSHQGKANAYGQVIQAVGCIMKFEAQFHKSPYGWPSKLSQTSYFFIRASMSFSGWVALVLKYWKTSLMPVKRVEKETGSLVAIQEQFCTN